MLTIEPMTMEHLDAVYAIETDSFSVPWTYESLRDEILKNKMAYYFVAVEGGVVIGYAGMWHVINEGHITNIAVQEEHRGKGIGAALVNRLIAFAVEKEMIGLTLEVRFGNAAAQRLYFKHGFTIEGTRKNYYVDTKEDALIMWKNLGPIQQ